MNLIDTGFRLFGIQPMLVFAHDGHRILLGYTAVSECLVQLRDHMDARRTDPAVLNLVDGEDVLTLTIPAGDPLRDAYLAMYWWLETIDNGDSMPLSRS